MFTFALNTVGMNPHANVTIDFLRFRGGIFHTSDKDIYRRAMQHPGLGKEFFDATPDEIKRQVLDTKERVKSKVGLKKSLSGMEENELRSLCRLNEVIDTGTPSEILKRLNNLAEIKFEEEDPKEELREKLSLLKISELRSLAVINKQFGGGSKQSLIDNLLKLEDIRWELKRSEIPISEMSEVAAQRKLTQKRTKNKIRVTK